MRGSEQSCTEYSDFRLSQTNGKDGEVRVYRHAEDRPLLPTRRSPVQIRSPAPLTPGSSLAALALHPDTLKHVESRANYLLTAIVVARIGLCPPTLMMEQCSGSLITTNCFPSASENSW